MKDLVLDPWHDLLLFTYLTHVLNIITFNVDNLLDDNIA